MSRDTYVQQLLADTRDEITRADTKASILLSLFGIFAGAVMYAFLRGQWTPEQLAPALELTWWLGAVAAALGIGLLAAAVYPVVKHKSAKESVTYFGHVVEFESRRSFYEALDQRAGSVGDRARDQAWVLSHVVARKHKRTRQAMWSFGVGLSLMLLAVGFQEWIL